MIFNLRVLRHVRLSALALVLFFLGGAVGCSSPDPKEDDQLGFAEGKVKYRLSWRGKAIDPMLQAILPTSMTIYFREPLVRTEMRSMGGLASVVTLVDTENGVSHVLVKVMGVKSHYEEAVSKNQLSLLFERDKMLRFPDMHIRDTTFLNYHCSAAAASLTGDSSAQFKFLFAPSVGWDSMNEHSPFQGLGGAVLKGRVSMFGMDMEVEATSLVATKLHDSLFSLPTDYRNVDRQTLMQLLGLDVFK